MTNEKKDIVASLFFNKGNPVKVIKRNIPLTDLMLCNVSTQELELILINFEKEDYILKTVKEKKVAPGSIQAEIAANYGDYIEYNPLKRLIDLHKYGGFSAKWYLQLLLWSKQSENLRWIITLSVAVIGLSLSLYNFFNTLGK